MQYELDESDRQAIVLAIARLSVERPGWNDYLGTIAEKLNGSELFATFRRYKEELPRPDIPPPLVATAQVENQPAEQTERHAIET